MTVARLRALGYTVDESDRDYLTITGHGYTWTVRRTDQGTLDQIADIARDLRLVSRRTILR